MKLYVAVKAKKNGKIGKPILTYGIATDPGEIFRNLSEWDELKTHHVACFEFKTETPLKLLLNEDSDYWSVEDEE